MVAIAADAVSCRPRAAWPRQTSRPALQPTVGQALWQALRQACVSVAHRRLDEVGVPPDASLRHDSATGAAQGDRQLIGARQFFQMS